jgi:hypothetical protein
MVRFLVISVLLITSSLSSVAADTYLRLKPDVVNDQLRQSDIAAEQRPEILRKAFLDAGCAANEVVEQKVPEASMSNVICTLRGSGPGTIVVATGLDFEATGDELLVDEATVRMLPLLVNSFRGSKLNNSVVFIGFTGAKKQIGSNYYLSQLSKDERKDILGMVFLDHLGRSPVRYLYPSRMNVADVANIGWDKHVVHDSTALNKQLDVAAKSADMEYPPELEEFFFTHALSFEHKGIDSLSLSSPAYTILARPKGTDVKMLSTAVNFRSYYETYNLLCVYLMKLDGALTSRKHHK